jgi:hypothetical protein
VLNKFQITLFLSLLGLLSFSQKAILEGVVTDQTNKPIDGVTVSSSSTIFITGPDGKYIVELNPGRQSVTFYLYGYVSQTKSVSSIDNTKNSLDVTLIEDVTVLGPIDLTDESERFDEVINIGEKEIEFSTGPNQGVEGLIRTLPGVVGTNEFSSQYNVRGGNFDENLVYVNGIEVYRPFLVRSGQQEGQSFINPDMVKNVRFSAGGFEAKYGDKMSSVLDIDYRRPKDFQAILQASLLGISLTAEGVSKDKRFTALGGFRYKTNQILLGSLDTKADFRPSFTDFQLLMDYELTDEITLGFFGTIGSNKYNVQPQSRQTDFGTFNEALRLNVFFEGQENYNYTTNSSAFSVKWEPNSDNQIEWITSAFQTKEQELVDVTGYYRLGELNNNLGSDDFGEVQFLRGVGGFQTNARNFLDAIIVSTRIRGLYRQNERSTWLYGIKVQHEDIIDRYKEWELIDSAGYSVTHDPSQTDPGVSPVIPTDGLELFASYDSKYYFKANRVMGYIENIQSWSKNGNQYKLKAGVRSQYYSVNGQTTVSPRASFSAQPDWKKNWVFRGAVGYYHQPPFYREMRNWEGELFTNIKAQQSIHFVAGADREFTMWNRPFKWVTEVYYKSMSNLVPYEIENVRIRYFPERSAKGYAAGVDFRVNGEFVKGIDSWGSVSIFTVKEDIDGDDFGYIPRPTDNRFSFSMYFQDYMPKDPSLRLSLAFTIVGGFPFGPPKTEPSERIYRSSPYRRVDIGFIKVFKDPSKENKSGLLKPFETFWIGLEIFNLLGTRNTVSYLWVRDASTQGQYAVPNYLTGRLLNLKLYMKI